MNEKENNNVFRFSLTQGEVLLCQKMFDADQFNPFTRYSIDVRDILPKIITKLQKILSKRNYDTVIEVGRIDINNPDSGEYIYDFYEYKQNIINSYPKEWRHEMRYSPQSITQQIEQKIDQKTEQKIIKGVPCKLGLYINDNPIVERDFFVDGFNPVAKESVDVLYLVIDIVDALFEKIKTNDIKNMWDDYDLINYMGMGISQIRELSPYKREELLNKIR